MAVLTEAERAVLTSRLADAEQQYHKLMLGQVAKVFVDQNGERIEYQQGSAAKLAAYIHGLKTQLGLVPVGCGGPLNVWM
jgi:hypothetical protein